MTMQSASHKPVAVYAVAHNADANFFSKRRKCLPAVNETPQAEALMSS